MIVWINIIDEKPPEDKEIVIKTNSGKHFISTNHAEHCQFGYCSEVRFGTFLNVAYWSLLD